MGCSAADPPDPPPAGGGGKDGKGIGSSTDPDDVLIDTGESGGGTGAAGVNAGVLNLGTEEQCDGMDENGNGIIDDVDVGKDGLCDCISIGFFGQVSSDAGSETGQFQNWLTALSGQVPIKNLGASGTLTAEWLDGLQVLIVGGMQDRTSGFSADEIAAFDDWLMNSGAGVITLGGYTASSSDIQPTNELIASTGMQYDTSSVPSEGVIGQDVAPPVWLSGIVAPDHPTVDGVAEIGVYFGYPVSGDGTVVLREGSYDLAMAKAVGAGRAFIFADEWITQDLTWSGEVEGGQDMCQQPCNEMNNICPIAESQCADCAAQPCSDPSETDEATCSKGCQPSCDNETMRCEMYTADCEACSAGSSAREQATARLWLNTIRWLTPQNECQVEIPPVIRVR
jgi:hypothetical protein